MTLNLNEQATEDMTMGQKVDKQSLRSYSTRQATEPFNSKSFKAGTVSHDDTNKNFATTEYNPKVFNNFMNNKNPSRTAA